MTRKRISKRKLQNFILALAKGTDLHTILRRRGYTLARAQQVLNSKKALAILASVRALARIQRSLIIRSVAPAALNSLRRQITRSAKPEHQIKGALSLLSLTTPRRSTPKQNTRQKHTQKIPPFKLPTEEAARQSLAREAQRRAAQRIKQFES